MPRAKVLLAAAMLLASLAARANGPRWITGPPYFTAPAGQPVVWYTMQPLYFTDPGDLSSYVNHSAADAMVAAASGVWNVPTAAIAIGYGGSLAEHVSGANTTASSSGPAFPQDVQATNYAAVQIAVIYDSDGSITDLLLGGGASDPAECAQNAVTEDVDSITPAGTIQHAVLVLNGRCTGPAPEQQLQMRYQLERAFGRILGLGWSQTNDNVFTGTPQPSYNQAMHWPILHPIDIVCGAYSYQCLPQPFTLRDDDVAAIAGLYPMLSLYSFPSTPPAPGKTWSYVQASQAYGTITFPTGQGMQGVNVELQRWRGGAATPEAWFDVSSVSGYAFQQNAGNPVLGPATGIAGSMGSADAKFEGYYQMTWIPDIDPAGSNNGPMTGVLTTEAVNPLYIGSYAVGPYVMGSVAPSGNALTQPTQYWLQNYLYPWSPTGTDLAPAQAASNCSTSGDGTELAPQPVPSSGWWNGVLCGHGHAAWSSFAEGPLASATIEITALDETGAATTAKAMPLIGVWAAGDATGTAPTIAATPSAFNTISLGTTATELSTTQPQSFRFVIADARGDGRPDFAYQARLLAASGVTPPATSINGGLITIQGMGFDAGIQVTVNGAAATVVGASSNTITAVAPPQSAFGGAPSGPVGITVSDPVTGGSTTLSGALTYGAVAPDTMALVSAPSGSAGVGSLASPAFTVRVLLGDGTTPAAGVPVSFSATSGSVQFGSAIVLTDANGLASTTVTPLSYGTVVLQAAAAGASVSASFQAVARSVVPVRSTEYVASGATVIWAPQVLVTQNGVALAGATVRWSGAAGLALSPTSTLTDANGLAQATAAIGPLSAGSQVAGQACAWATQCATFSAVALDPALWRVTVVSGAGQSVTPSGAFLPVTVRVTDPAGDPVAGAVVAIHQTATAWQMPCPAAGRCPVPPTVAAATISATSDADGLVTIAPMQLAGTPEFTNIAVAAGSNGFVSLSLTQGP